MKQINVEKWSAARLHEVLYANGYQLLVTSFQFEHWAKTSHRIIVEYSAPIDEHPPEGLGVKRMKYAVVVCDAHGDLRVRRA